jgi:hypothetical protein
MLLISAEVILQINTSWVITAQTLRNFGSVPPLRLQPESVVMSLLLFYLRNLQLLSLKLRQALISHPARLELITT